MFGAGARQQVEPCHVLLQHLKISTTECKPPTVHRVFEEPSSGRIGGFSYTSRPSWPRGYPRLPILCCFISALPILAGPSHLLCLPPEPLNLFATFPVSTDIMFQANRLPRAAVCGLALLGAGVSAQSSGSPTATQTASSISSSAIATHTVLVGKADHKFEPDVTQARVGDFIKFQFYPTNHSVVRAEYGYPCVPYEMTGVGKTGFYAGFHPVDAILDDPPSYQVRINDTDPIFFYCSAPGSCINYEMVGVINPNKSTSLQVQKDKAGQSSFALSPGETFPDEAASSSVLSGAAQATATSTTTATAAATASSSDSSSLSGGAIAGIVVGAVAVIAILAALFFFVGRNKSLKEKVSRQSATMSPHMAGSPPMFQSPVGIFPQNNPYFQRSNMGSMGGGPPSYTPAMDEYSTANSGSHSRSYFTEVGMYPHHNAMSDGISRSSNAGSPPPPASSPPPPMPSPVPKKAHVHEMAG